MSTWKTLPQQQPADGEEVWIRLNYWFGAPFLAKWSDGDKTFEYNVGGSIIYPAWTVGRWKPQ